jgi:hypothetical protein
MIRQRPRNIGVWLAAGRGVAVRSAMAAVLACVSAPLAAAQPAPSAAEAQPPSAIETPTTRVLAIGRLTHAPGAPDVQSLMPTEVRDTVDLYLGGKIAQWYVAKDAPGVVFILDVRSTDEARALTSGLPLVKAGLMQFQLIPLGPLAPLRWLTK